MSVKSDCNSGKRVNSSKICRSCTAISFSKNFDEKGKILIGLSSNRPHKCTYAGIWKLNLEQTAVIWISYCNYEDSIAHKVFYKLVHFRIICFNCLICIFTQRWVQVQHVEKISIEQNRNYSQEVTQDIHNQSIFQYILYSNVISLMCRFTIAYKSKLSSDS